MYGSKFSPATGGIVTEGRARVWVSGASSPGARMAIYSDNAGEPNALLALSDETVVNNTTEAEKAFTFSGANQIVITGGTQYWIAVLFDDPGTPNFTISRANTAAMTRFKGITYPTAPDPYAADGSSNGPLDLYIIYTEATITEVAVTADLEYQVTRKRSPMHVQAWLYPGSPAENANEEYSDGRKIDVLKPEYQRLGTDGVLVQLNDPADGENAYSSGNATDVLANCTEAFFTVSGHTTGLVAMIGNASNAIDSTKRANFISTLVSFVQTIGFHGVDIDIEGYGAWDATTTSRFVDLMDDLGIALHAVNKKLSVCLPAISDITYQGFFELTYESFNGLAIDQFTVMAYDYMFDYGAQNPIQPISWLEDICDWALDKFDASEHHKIVIGIPSYGFYGTNAPDSYDIEIQTKDQIDARTGYSGATRDSSSFEMTWVNGGFVNWYVDAYALMLKAQVVAGKGINRVSVWHLGGNDWFLEPFAPTKELRYEVTTAAPTEQLIQKDLDYAVQAEHAAVTKALVYRVQAEISAITKGMIYRVQAEVSAITKTLLYKVTNEVSAITKGAIYRVIREISAITKDLEYGVQGDGINVTKAMVYMVLAEKAAITKTAIYRVITEQSAITKGLIYRVITEAAALTKALAYAVQREIAAITKSATYRVTAEQSAITKALTYRVSSEVSAIQKDLEYAVTVEAAITKGMAYEVTTEAAITKPMAYAVELAPVVIQKGMHYIVVFQGVETKEMTYALRRYPYTRKISPYRPMR